MPTEPERLVLRMLVGGATHTFTIGRAEDANPLIQAWTLAIARLTPRVESFVLGNMRFWLRYDLVSAMWVERIKVPSADANTLQSLQIKMMEEMLKRESWQEGSNEE